MIFDTQMSDAAVLAELGRRLTCRRIDLELTQAELARQAGISKRTLERIEAGDPSQVANLVRVLRALDLLAGLEQLVPEPIPRPLALLRAQGRVRQRASRRGRASTRTRTTASGGWTWGDER